jgi:hypothetical protein
MPDDPDPPDNPLMRVMEERPRDAEQQLEMLQRIAPIIAEYPPAVRLAAYLDVLRTMAAKGEIVATIDVGNDDPFYVIETVSMAVTMPNTAILWLAPERRFIGDGSTKFKPLSAKVHAKRTRHAWDTPAPDGQSDD